MRWAKALSRNDTEVGIRQCQALEYFWLRLVKVQNWALRQAQ